MTELLLPDFLGAYNNGVDRGKKSKLAQLVGQAANAAPADRQSALQKIGYLDGPTAIDAQKALGAQDDDIHDRIIQRAGMVASLWKTNPQMAQAAYQGMPQMAAQAGLGQVPPQLDEKVAKALEDMSKLAMSSTRGASSELQTFGAMTQGMSPEDVARARRIQLGLDPRAVTGATKFDTFTGADGRPRPQRNNPTTGGVEIYYDEAGQWVPLGQGRQPQGASPQAAPQQSAPTQEAGGMPVEFSNADAVPPQVRAAIEANPDGWGQVPDGTAARIGPQGPMVPGLGVGRRAEDEAGAVEAAKQAAQINALPTRNALDAQGAGMKAGAEASAKAETDRRYGIGTALDADKAIAERHAKLNQALDAVDGVRQAAEDIHALTQMPGYQLLGTVQGDAAQKIPLARNSVKDAAAQLEGVRSKTIVEALSKMKALSANGASGWGSLTEKEEQIIADSVAVLKSGTQSHAAIDAALAKISRTLDNSAKRLGSNIRQFRGAGQQAPASGRVLKFNPATGKIE